MPRDIYLICLTGEEENREVARTAIHATWDERFPLDDDTILVVDTNAEATSKIRDKLLEAVKTPSPPLFFVVPVVYYGGYNSKSLWEWLSKRLP